MISASNLYPLPESGEVARLRQTAADRMLSRFQVAGMVGMACHVNGWLLQGPSPLSVRYQPDNSFETLFSNCSFEWQHPSQVAEGYEVRLILGDISDLYVRRSEAEGWQEIPCDLLALCRVLDSWLDELLEVPNAASPY